MITWQSSLPCELMCGLLHKELDVRVRPGRWEYVQGS